MNKFFIFDVNNKYNSVQVDEFMQFIKFMRDSMKIEEEKIDDVIFYYNVLPMGRIPIAIQVL